MASISGTNLEALKKRQEELKKKGRRTRLVKSGRIPWGKGTKQYYTLHWH